MSWPRRIVDLIVAGGVLAGGYGDNGQIVVGGCNGNNPGKAVICNANPDPCCCDPYSQACADYHRDLSVPLDMQKSDMSSRD